MKMLGTRVAIKINKKQEETLLRWIDATVFAYNYCLKLHKQYMEIEHKNLDYYEMYAHLVDMKHSDPDFDFLNGVPVAALKCSIKDLEKRIKLFYNGSANYPHTKDTKKCKKSVYIREDRVYSIDNRHIKIPGIKKPVKTYENCILPSKPRNPRIKYDGKYWYFCFATDIAIENKEVPVIKRNLENYRKYIKPKTASNPIGIDLGINKTAVISDGSIYKNINKENKEIQRIEEKIKKVQRIFNRKFLANRGMPYSINILKTKEKITLLLRRLTNIRNDYIEKMTTEIIRRKPSGIVIEDLKIKNLVRNHYLAKAILQQKWYWIRLKLEYKCEINSIPIKAAPWNYPSSKTCSRCGYIYRGLKLSERIFKCPLCKNRMDRDLNAAINLSTV